MGAEMVEIAAGKLSQPAEGGGVRALEVAAFAIDRHLVTVGAYREFVEERGYAQRASWTEAGWRWREANNLSRPRFWDEAEWKPFLDAHHPIVGVSAFEAEAFAAWRGARLPRELEWERACRGDDARAFPWGEAWIEGCCGHRDTGVRCTRPVGAFPAGASALGVHDLVGSVWQWTSDVARVISRGGRQLDGRVVRGGAWNNLRSGVGCGARNAFAADARFSNLGFRCAADAR